MTYTIGSTNPRTDWNYEQGAYFVGGVPQNMVWHVAFYLTNLPAGGNLTLNAVWA